MIFYSVNKKGTKAYSAMPIAQAGQLFKLVKTLTKAEKRHFKLYAKKIKQKGDVRFLKLFELLEKQDSYDEILTLSQFKKINKSQLTNLKRNLYKHLLISLRLLESKKQIEIQIREYTDFADILYNRGLYLQALKILAKAKKLAVDHHLDLLHLEVIEFEKRIESRHITRSSTERMNDLINESSKRIGVMSSIVELSNLKLRLQRWFINNGHMTKAKDQDRISRQFNEEVSGMEKSLRTFFEKVYYYQAHFWYHYILVEFDQCLLYAEKWIKLYNSNPAMIQQDVDMYMKGLHHYLTMAFFLNNAKLHKKLMSHFEVLAKEDQKLWHKKSSILYFLFSNQSRLNQSFLDRDYKEGIAIISKMNRQMKNYENQLDPHKLMIFYYKFACLYIANRQPAKAIDYLLLINNSPAKHLRTDIQVYSRLLQCVAHYDLGHRDILDYLTRSTERFVNKIITQERIPSTILQLFKQLIRTPDSEQAHVFAHFREILIEFHTHKIEQRGFIFFDFIAWGKRNMEPSLNTQKMAQQNGREK